MNGGLIIPLGQKNNNLLNFLSSFSLGLLFLIMSLNILRTLEALSALKLNCEQQQRRCSVRVESASSYLQQQDEIVHRVVSCVQVVTRAQAVVGVKVHFLVDARVTEQVEQDLLRDASGAEVLHLCRGQRSETQGSSQLAVWATMSHNR